MDRGPWLGTVDRRLARPAHPPCPYPGNERRQLSPQAEPPQTNPDRRTLDPIPNAPRGRRAASATLQRPSTPKSHNNRPAIYWPTFTPTHWPVFAPPLTVRVAGMLILHNGSITKPEARWTLQKA